MEERIGSIGMTDRQFDAYQARLIKILKMIAEIEAELKRP